MRRKIITLPYGASKELLCQRGKIFRLNGTSDSPCIINVRGALINEPFQRRLVNANGGTSVFPTGFHIVQVELDDRDDGGARELVKDEHQIKMVDTLRREVACHPLDNHCLRRRGVD